MPSEMPPSLQTAFQTILSYGDSRKTIRRVPTDTCSCSVLPNGT
ncbi:hypothetical protein NEIPOLOT_01705 [Neisseria polysaccharea ATCC 43768]|nr:hypothetical protein NEIPOLOT_01705 [Neisseria polysaccharea ATCC 43768]